MSPNLERRSTSSAVGASLAPTRAGATAARLGGYAAVFDEITVIAGQFRERIAPGAFRAAIGRDDVRCLLNHLPDNVLGRTKAGTLRLWEDARGLRYECDINPSDPQALSTLEKVRRGDISQSSFSFEVENENWEGGGSRSALPLRIITAVRLFDCAPVTFPAYQSTTVSARAVTAAAWQAQLAIARQRLRIAQL